MRVGWVGSDSLDSKEGVGDVEVLVEGVMGPRGVAICLHGCIGTREVDHDVNRRREHTWLITQKIVESQHVLMVTVQLAGKGHVLLVTIKMVGKEYECPVQRTCARGLHATYMILFMPATNSSSTSNTNKYSCTIKLTVSFRTQPTVRYTSEQLQQGVHYT